MNFKQIGWKWYGVIFLIFPAILVVGYFFHALFGGEIPSYEMYFGGIGSAGDLLFFIFLMLLGGPLAEELGWRGYCLDPLQKKFGAVMASLIIGVIWIAWHLPLFFVEGTSQYAKGFGVAFWSWSLQIVAISLIFTWVYNNNGRSILSAILLHLMANIAYPLNLDAQGEFIFSLVRVAVAVLLVLVFLKKPAHEQLVEAKKVVV